MRPPWKSPSDGRFSYTTLWLNIAYAVTLLRYFIGDASVTIFGWEYTPTELDSMLPAAVLGAVSGLYYARRGQEGVQAGKSNDPDAATIADGAR